MSQYPGWIDMIIRGVAHRMQTAMTPHLFHFPTGGSDVLCAPVQLARRALARVHLVIMTHVSVWVGKQPVSMGWGNNRLEGGRLLTVLLPTLIT